MLGVLTFHNATNYGAVLQTYALQKELDELGIDNEIIDYRCPHIVQSHKVRFKFKNPFGYVVKKRTQKLFRDFLNTRIRKGAPVDSEVNMPGYDAFLVGSDQVWNRILTGGDDMYFLMKVPRNSLKYSYAASMGYYHFADETERQKYTECLKDFRGISVRERSLKDYFASDGCAELKQKMEIHSDPVFLMNASFWREQSLHTQNPGFILLYMIKRDKRLIDEAVRLGKEKKTAVIWASDSFRHYKHVKQRRCLGPQKFLGLFADSEYVVTNSFHGTVLSLIFQKDFSTVVEYDGQRDERICDLLDSVGIEVMQNKGIAKPINTINWNLVEKRRLELKKQAEGYLKRVKEDIDMRISK